MGDMIADGVAWMHNQRHSHMTQTVTYERPSSSQSVAINVTWGRSRHDMPSEYGGVIRVESRDILLRAADLILGSVTLPQRGDRVTDADDYSYEVLSPGGDLPEWEYSDHARDNLRVHLKRIDVE